MHFYSKTNIMATTLNSKPNLQNSLGCRFIDCGVQKRVISNARSSARLKTKLAKLKIKITYRSFWHFLSSKLKNVFENVFAAVIDNHRRNFTIAM